MKLAAIDIGSNAIRLQITKVLEHKKVITFKKLEYVRFPLRLGHDVFLTGRISEYNKKRFFKLMIAYKHLIDLYEIDAFYGCATSAMRESENGSDIINHIRNELGLDIKIISGNQEAEMINEVILQNLDNKQYIHIDVGGGSTELNIYENHKKTYSHSFKIGSVRILEGKETPDSWKELREWVEKFALKNREEITALGTGGNINKLFELTLTRSKSKQLHLKDLIKTYDFLRKLSLDDRLNKLQLNPDRADVIIPAATIYIAVMQAAKVEKIIVPDVGLKDGINYYLFKTYYPNSSNIFVKN